MTPDDSKPTLTELHRRWMHARLAHEQAERAVEEALGVAEETGRELREAENQMGVRLLEGETAGAASRARSRLVAIAGEALRVYECGVDYPAEYGIEVIPLELVPLD